MSSPSLSKGFILCTILSSFFIFSIIFLSESLSLIISILVVLFFLLLEHFYKKDVANELIIFPIFVSCFQNIYLSISCENKTSFGIQILLTIHFLLVLSIVCLNFFRYSIRKYSILFFILLVQSIILYFFYPSNVISFLSSIRNIESCILFYCFSLLLSKRLKENNFINSLILIAWIVVLFGLLDYFTSNVLWKSFGITRLWQLKNIPINSEGIPNNWYSSEYINGHVVSRMVSTFADPVNLGTFLFAIFLIAWKYKKRILMVLIILCSVLTVSKGSLLGFLIFIMVYFYEKRGFKFLIPIISIFVLFIALYFVIFSINNSTGSMMVHIKGFLSSFKILLSHPFGLGVGNVGVLAKLFSKTSLASSVTETGIGMIIAQLGIIGLIVYIIFFINLFCEPRKWKNNNYKTKIFYFALLFSIFANAMFNEVALSPNSCGIYFIMLAFINVQMNSTKNIYLNRNFFVLDVS